MLAETVDRWKTDTLAEGRAEGLLEAASKMVAAGTASLEVIARTLGLNEAELRGRLAAP